MDLTGKTAVITGAARGLGRSIALELAKEGMNIVAVDLRKHDLDTVVTEITGLNKKVLALESDVSDLASVKRMASDAIKAFGKIDVLVNNAGVVIAKPFAEMERSDWDTVIDINLGGVFNCCSAIAPHMIENKNGRIVNISSVAGKKAAPLLSAYSASKHGVIGLTQGLAIDLAPYNITANVVCPGVINTPMWSKLAREYGPMMGIEPDKVFDTFTCASIPLKRPQTGEDIGQCVVFLCKADNISGVAINVDGGMTMV